MKSKECKDLIQAILKIVEYDIAIDDELEAKNKIIKAQDEKIKGLELDIENYIKENNKIKKSLEYERTKTNIRGNMSCGSGIKYADALGGKESFRK